MTLISRIFRKYGYSTTKKSLKIFLAAEAAGFLILFTGYVKMNRDPEFRYKLYENPKLRQLVVEPYYQLGEVMNSELKIREHDRELWQSQGKKLD